MISAQDNPGGSGAPASRIIAIDLDGSLLRTDSLVEALLKLIKRDPLNLLRAVSWLARGKTVLKEEVANAVSLDVETLPYNQAVVEWAQVQKRNGARLVLATATHDKTARAIADHLGFFDDVVATNATRNLKSAAKREVLVELYGEAGYEYIGNESADLEVWRSASVAHVVGSSAGLLAKVRKISTVGENFAGEKKSLRTFLRAIRLHQWAKNLLIFVPLASAHQVTNIGLLADGLIAFVLFGITSSTVYLLNDLLDLEDDRRHATKFKRPLAAGEFSHATALVLIPCAVVGVVVLSLLLLPVLFSGVLLTYLAVTLAYTFWFKRRVLVDVVTLAVLYTLRILGGVAAFELTATFWMLAFSIFLFLSLAFVKRYTELVALRKNPKAVATPGRGYYADDFQLLVSLGTASGYVSVLVLALYIQDSMTRVLYSRPEVVWLSCLLLLYWISRTWLIAHRGHMHDDPVVFALKDRTSLLVGALFVATFLAAI